MVCLCPACMKSSVVLLGCLFFLNFFAVMFIPMCLVSFPLLEILPVPLAAISNANSLGLFIDMCVSVSIYIAFFLQKIAIVISRCTHLIQLLGS